MLKRLMGTGINLVVLVVSIVSSCWPLSCSMRWAQPSVRPL
jgi:hypothetical protein